MLVGTEPLHLAVLPKFGLLVDILLINEGNIPLFSLQGSNHSVLSSEIWSIPDTTICMMSIFVPHILI